MISTKPLDQLSAADLNDLLAEKRPEGRRLDYKRDLELSNNEHKRELARDVSAFANAAGGDLVYGIEEQEGVPTSIVGVACPDFDQTKLRFEAILADNIEPRVQGIDIQKIDGGFAKGPVVVVRIPKSWTAPHMVTSTASTFWTRSNSGRQALDVQEIRAAFLVGTDMATRVRRFRDERLGRILARDTPVPLRSGKEATVVVHVVPLAAEPVLLDLHKIEGTPGMLRPPGTSGGWNDRFNLDGLVAFAGPSQAEQRCYCQVFRDGRIESVSCGFQYPGKDGQPRELYALPVETEVVQSLEAYIKLLTAHGFGGPISVMLTVLGVKDSRIKTGDDWMAAPWEEGIVIDRDTLVLPDVVVEQLPADPRAFMRDVFDVLWQSSGYKRSAGYSQAGEWDAKKHRG